MPSTQLRFRQQTLRVLTNTRFVSGYGFSHIVKRAHGIIRLQPLRFLNPPNNQRPAAALLGTPVGIGIFDLTLGELIASIEIVRY